MELRHLRYFIAVAEHESIRLAAQRIHVTQPAISRQIQDLETELGFLLFERQRNRLVLTPAGRSYLDEARLALARLEAAAKSGRRLAKGLSGQLRIGFVENAGWDGLVPDTFARFQETVPDVDLELRPQNSPHQIEDILSGALDGGFIYHIGALPAELVAVPLIEQGVVLAAPRSWGIESGSAVALRALAERPFILFPRAMYPAYHDIMIEACRRIDVTLNVVQEENTETAILALVCSGVGGAIVNAANLSRPVARASFSPLLDLSIRLPLVFVHRAGNDDPILARFLAALHC